MDNVRVTKVGREVTLRYELDDPTLVQAEPVAESVRGDRTQYLVFIVLGGFWLLGYLAYRSSSTPGAFLDRRVQAWNRRHRRSPSGGHVA